MGLLQRGRCGFVADWVSWVCCSCNYCVDHQGEMTNITRVDHLRRDDPCYLCYLCKSSKER